MSTPSGPLKLTGPLGEQKFYNTQSSIAGDYRTAEVLSSNPRSLWVVYTVTEWDHNHPGDRDVEKIVRAGQTVTMPSSIRSIQGFDEMNPGVIMFEHSQHRGYASLFRNTNPDITDSFGQGKVSGVSSMIITGGKWSFYTGFNSGGTKVNIGGQSELGPGVYDLGYCITNDQIKSIQYVQAS